MDLFSISSDESNYRPSISLQNESGFYGVSVSWIPKRDYVFEDLIEQKLREERKWYEAIREAEIEKRVNEKIEDILKERATINFRQVSEKLAEKYIIKFLTQRHKEGIFEISILDIALFLKLPPRQVDKIMKQFEKKNRVKEL